MKYLLAAMLLASMPAMAYEWETRYQQEQRARDYADQMEAQERRIQQMENRLRAQEYRYGSSSYYAPSYPSTYGSQSERINSLVTPPPSLFERY